MKQKPIKIYTADYCPYCKKAISLLKSKNLEYEEIELDQASREALVKRTNWQTVPQIFIGEGFIGGCDDLYALEHNGKLDSMVYG